MGLKSASVVYAVISFVTFTSWQFSNRVYIGGDLPEVVVNHTRGIPTHLKQYQLILARLVQSEAGGESFIGKRAVADAVLNMAELRNESVTDVIYTTGLYDGVGTSNFTRKPTPACLEAARLALLGDRVLPPGVVHFYNPFTSNDSIWVSHISRFKYKRFGNHIFCWNPVYYRNYRKNL